MPPPPTPTVRFPWRMAIYGIAILYIGADMYVFHGPLSKMIDRMYGRGIEEQIAKVPTGLVATVNTWPITVADLDRRVWDYCTVRGLKMEEIDPKRQQVIRAVALNRLINELAVWHYAKLTPVEVTDGEIDAAVAQVRGQFSSEEAFAKRLAGQAMDAKSFRTYITDQVHQRKWLEAKAAKHITVSEEEAKAWYESDEESRTVPERWRARQVFVPTSEAGDAAQAHAELEAAAGELADRELVWLSRERMPEDFIDTIAAQPVGEVGKAFQTELGWHLVEVTEHREAREASFEEMRTELLTFLENRKRKSVIEQIVRDYRKRAKIWPPVPKPQAILEGR